MTNFAQLDLFLFLAGVSVSSEKKKLFPEDFLWMWPLARFSGPTKRFFFSDEIVWSRARFVQGRGYTIANFFKIFWILAGFLWATQDFFYLQMLLRSLAKTLPWGARNFASTGIIFRIWSSFPRMGHDFSTSGQIFFCLLWLLLAPNVWFFRFWIFD